MTYELAKQLKDAGFRQGTFDYDSYIGVDDIESHLYFSGTNDSDVFIPTLSELIEACGDEFDSLDRTFDGLWEAWNYNENDEHTVLLGSTPEEAVAKLWLKLKEK